MKVYVVEYFDYDEHYIKGIFTDEKEACIFKESISDKENDTCLFIKSYDLTDHMYDVSKYKFFKYYYLTYAPFTKYPVVSIDEQTGVEGITNKEFLDSPDNIRLVNQYVRTYIKADSIEEAETKFYDLYADAINKYYVDNNITKQNGKIKTWKKPLHTGNW